MNYRILFEAELRDDEDSYKEYGGVLSISSSFYYSFRLLKEFVQTEPDITSR